MLDLSPTKLIIVFIVVIVLLGPKRLPQVARQLGAVWRKMVGFQQQIEHELRQTMPDLPSSQDIVRFARSPVTMLNQLAQMPVHDADAPVEDPGAPAPGSAPAVADGAAAVEPGTGARPESGVGADTGVGADGDGHWPEDPASNPPIPPGRPALQPSNLADLGALAADDPAMN